MSHTTPTKHKPPSNPVLDAHAVAIRLLGKQTIETVEIGRRHMWFPEPYMRLARDGGGQSDIEKAAVS